MKQRHTGLPSRPEPSRGINWTDECVRPYVDQGEGIDHPGGVAGTARERRAPGSAGSRRVRGAPGRTEEPAERPGVIFRRQPYAERRNASAASFRDKYHATITRMMIPSPPIASAFVCTITVAAETDGTSIAIPAIAISKAA